MEYSCGYNSEHWETRNQEYFNIILKTEVSNTIFIINVKQYEPFDTVRDTVLSLRFSKNSFLYKVKVFEYLQWQEKIQFQNTFYGKTIRKVTES